MQAARAHALGLPLESAYSWGLNRAIFYAAAKRGFKGGGSTTSTSGGRRPAGSSPSGKDGHSADTYYLGDDMAFKAEGPGPLRFTIGGKTQTKEDFERQIEARFNGKFKDAWEDAVDYINHIDRSTLSSGEEFFVTVYRPKRDEFAASWTEMSDAEPRAAPGPVKASASQSSGKLPSRRPRSSR